MALEGREREILTQREIQAETQRKGRRQTQTDKCLTDSHTHRLRGTPPALK